MFDIILFQNFFKKHVKTGARSIIALSFIVVLAGCSSSAPQGNPDAEAAFPYKVTKKTFSLGFPVPKDGGQLTGENRNRLAFFAQAFLRRARSPITITTATSDSNSANSAKLVKRELISAGIHSEAIILKSVAKINDKTKALVLSFDGYAIKVPNCGSWQGHNGFNPTGLPHTDFGCSVRRNLGLMISDPGDLVVPRIAGRPDAPSSDRVIGAHRTGQPTGTAEPVGEKGTVSSVAKE